MHRRAKANFEMGNYDLAVKDFQEVMSLDPNNAEVHFHSFKDHNFFLFILFFIFNRNKENI